MTEGTLLVKNWLLKPSVKEFFPAVQKTWPLRPDGMAARLCLRALDLPIHRHGDRRACALQVFEACCRRDPLAFPKNYWPSGRKRRQYVCPFLSRQGDAAGRLVWVNEPIILPKLEQVIPYARAKDIILENPGHIAVMSCPACRLTSA